MFRKFLVPTDGSEISIAGAMRALALARELKARMTVVFVQDTYPYTGIGETNSAGLQAYTAAARAEGTTAIHRIQEAAKAEGVAVESIIVEDHQAARGIVDAAGTSSADLIVMGSHGRSGLAKMVLGSVAAKVLALSPIPVLIVK